MIKVRKYKGNPPAAADGWVKLTEVCEHTKKTWSLWARPGRASWVTIKLVADTPKTHEATDWRGCSLAEQRLPRGGDTAVMIDHRPSLAAAIAAALAEHADALADGRAIPKIVVPGPAAASFRCGLVGRERP